MAQMTESLARAILNGDGCTRHELEQLCRHFLATPAGSASGEDVARNELACCDDVPLQNGLAAGIAHLREQRDALQAEVARLTSENKTLERNLVAAMDAVHRADKEAETAEAALAEARRDAERLDWLERAGDVYFGIVVDAPHDGEYSLHHDLAGQPAFGPTLRAAIDAAMGSANGQG